MEFDEILVKIGESGRVQIVLYLLLGIVGIPCGMQNLAMVFMGASMDHYCNISELDEKQIIAFSAKQPNNGSCEIYDMDYSQLSNQSFNNLSLSINDTVKCSSWIYDRSIFKSSVRSRWDLVCSQNYVVALMQTIYMCGFLSGAVTFGIVSDRIGRLKTMMICCLIMITTAVLAAIASEYWDFITFTIIRFFVGMSTAGLYTITFVLSMEIISPRLRTYTGIIYQCFFAIGFCVLPGIAYGLRDLLHTQLAAALPAVVLLSYYFFVPESPRWLIQQGRYNEADIILKKIAKLNEQPLPEDFTVSPGGAGCTKISEGSDNSSKFQRGTLIDIFRYQRMRYRALVCAYCWFVCGMTYYGLSYSAEELGGSIFLNTLISGLVEYPAYIACLVIVVQPKIGRKYSLSASFVIGGVALLVCVPLLKDKKVKAYHIALLVCANIGKLALSAAFAIVYIFTAEIFPTVARSACVGTSSMAARIGALLAPQIMLLSDYWYGVPYIFFGVIAIGGGLLTLYLPESINAVLPETLDDGELFGTKSYMAIHHINDNKTSGASGAVELTLLGQQDGKNESTKPSI